MVVKLESEFVRSRSPALCHHKRPNGGVRSVSLPATPRALPRSEVCWRDIRNGRRRQSLQCCTLVSERVYATSRGIRWDEAGHIIDFKVMVRPLKAVNLLHAQMRAMLESMK